VESTTSAAEPTTWRPRPSDSTRSDTPARPRPAPRRR
jgi:hypothetical protein